GETSKFVSGKYFDSKPMLYVNGKTGSVYGFEEENANQPLVAGITLNYEALTGLILNASDIREQYSVDLFKKAVAEYESGNHQNGPGSVYKLAQQALRAKQSNEGTVTLNESVNQALADRGWTSIRPNADWPKIRHGVTLHPEYRSDENGNQIAGIRVSHEAGEVKTVVGGTRSS